MNMEFIDKAYFDKSIEGILYKLNSLEKKLQYYNDENLIDQELLDNQDVCQLLKISKATLQRYRRQRKIAYQIIGKKCYYQKQDIKEFIDTHHERFFRKS